MTIEQRPPAGLERRKEDYNLIRGRSGYVDDLRPPAGRPAALAMVVVRSPYAHAAITGMDLEAARSLDGVVAVLSGEELVQKYDVPPFPVRFGGSNPPQRYPLAVERVRYVGDPVAVVLAENLYAATDGCDRVDVDYDPLPVVVDLERALEPDAPLLYPERKDNVLFHQPLQGGDITGAFARADSVVKLRLENQRLIPASMEPRACLFDYDQERGQFTAWVSSQSVYQVRNTLSHFLKLPPERIQVHNADVGGAFGAKSAFLGEEIVAALLALKYARPVKWIEDRGENLQAHMHGRGQINYIEGAYTADGRLLGMRVRILGDVGAFSYGAGGFIPASTARMITGAYTVEAIDCDVTTVMTNKVPTGAYRGAGRPEATYIIERTIDAIARELKLDPVEVRRRNLIPSTAFPYNTPTGLTYDSGNYQRLLDKALALAEYTTWRERQQERRADPHAEKLLGIGVSTFIETSGGGAQGPGAPHDAATVRILRDGTIQVQSTVAHNGQGHFTLFSQMVADVFAVPGSQVDVRLNDVSLPGYSVGTFGSRTTQSSGVAIHLAAQAAREKALQLAAHTLEAASADLELVRGRFVVRGVPARSVELGTLAQLAEEQPELIEHDAPNPANGAPVEGLAAWRSFNPSDMTISSGAHIAIVEITRETGDIQILRYIAVDDGGRILNHYLAEAQMHGSLAQGIGQALFEGVFYDEDGQNLTSSFMDYAMPTSAQLPTFEIELVETPSPINPLGVKGIGEAGTIGAPPTIVNAVLDALAPFGVTSLDMPLLPEKIWQALNSTQA